MLGVKRIDGVMIGTTHFVNAVVQRRSLTRTAALRLCLPATTLGDVYSLVLYPAISSHRALSPAERAAVGIGEGLVRLSVGIEDVDDIVADLDQALQAAVGRAAVAPAAALSTGD